MIACNCESTFILQGKSKESRGKGKQDDVELFELPPQQRTLGSCYIPLITLIEGDHVIDTKSVCTPTEPAECDAEKKHEGAAGKAGTPTGKAANTSEKKKNTKGFDSMLTIMSLD